MTDGASLPKKLIERHAAWQATIPSQYSHLIEKREEESLLTFDWLSDELAVVGTFPTKEDLEKGQKPELLILAPGEDSPPIKRYSFESEVNKAVAVTRHGRTCIAAMCENGDIYLIKVGARGGKPRLLGSHPQGGFALAWSPSGYLAAASGPNCPKAEIYIWKVDFKTLEATKLHEICITDAKSCANALVWSDQLLVAGTEQGRLYIFENGREIKRTLCHKQSVNGIALSPFSKSLLATVAADGSIYLWNLGLMLASRAERPRSKPEAILPSYGGEVNTIQFSPHIDGVLATGTDNGLVVIWDLCNLGKTLRISPEEVVGLETVYCHSGHVMSVADLAWHPTKPGVLCSVSEDCRIQVWKPRVLDHYPFSVGGQTTRPPLDIPALPSEDIDPDEMI